MRLGSGIRRDGDGKTIYDLIRARYDDEAVTLGQMKHITDKKIDMDNLLPQTLKRRLLIPDYDSSDNSDEDVINKKYIDPKTFTLDVSEGLDMKDNKVINLADPTSATDGSNKKYVDTETSNYLKTDGTRVMSGNLNLKSRSIINVKQAQAYESTHALINICGSLTLVFSIQLSTIIIIH